VKRGEVWWASLGEPRGSEPGYQRPIVIISANAFNRSAIQTVIVTVVTSNLRLVEAPGNFSVSKEDSGLSKESVVNVSQLLTLDKSFLVEKIKTLPKKKILSLNEGIKLSLGLNL
jgi:mRNA interferase MazF